MMWWSSRFAADPQPGSAPLPPSRRRTNPRTPRGASCLPPAGAPARDARFDLVHGLVAARVEPDLLGLRSHDARQLAHRGERQLALLERTRDRRKLLERERHP